MCVSLSVLCVCLCFLFSCIFMAVRIFAGASLFACFCFSFCFSVIVLQLRVLLLHSLSPLYLSISLSLSPPLCSMFRDSCILPCVLPLLFAFRASPRAGTLHDCTLPNNLITVLPRLSTFESCASTIFFSTLIRYFFTNTRRNDHW